MTERLIRPVQEASAAANGGDRRRSIALRKLLKAAGLSGRMALAVFSGFWLAVAAGLIGAPAYAQDDTVGYVRSLTADAFLERDGTEIVPAIGDPVYRTDIVLVDETGGIGITFVDNTVLSFGPNTRFVLLDYSFSPQDEDFGFVGQLLRGSFLYTSGDIGRRRPDAVRLQTPSGFIGIRGTRFAAAISGD